ncbi:MAG TPA: tripartite tricarboxylate transporter TctB family protein [Acetobacteraceae bacterium]|nr:tripartite tricarboxylate transporter TctB family protein [Acetobacteraceae bacterium]
MRSVSFKDLVGGGLMLLLGIGAAVQAAQYQIGSLRDMGPGYVPLALGILLAVTGALIMLAALRTATITPAVALPPEWRGWACICAGMVAFAVIGLYGGLLPATFACVFIAALGDRKNSLLAALVLAASMTVVCLIVFWWLLKVQLPLFRWA